MMHFRRPKVLLVAATALLLTVSVSSVSAAAQDVSPPGANNFSCKPSAQHPYPVILVPGTYESMAKNWAVMSPQLKKAGYCVFSLNYGVQYTVPAAGPIEHSAKELSYFVASVLHATKATRVDLVGHSQGGGLMPRYYLRFLGGTNSVHALIGIAPNNHGTTLTPNPLSYAPGVSTGGDGAPSTVAAPATLTAPSDGDLNAAARQQSAGSPLLTKLNAGGDIKGSVRYTTIATTHDEVVTPYTSEALAGPSYQVTNVVIQKLCPLDPIDHDQTPNDPVVQQLVLAALGNPNGLLSRTFRPSCV